MARPQNERRQATRQGVHRLVVRPRRGGDEHQTFRILFATEGRTQQVLLALEGFSKKTQKTPPEVIRRAEKRLADWHRRARA